MGKRAHDDSDGESGEERASKSSKKTKSTRAAVSDGQAKDSEGNPYWELSAMRRVTTSKFKNNLLISIREFYEAGGEKKPGKKGISLTIDQYKAFLKAVPEINAALRKDGCDVGDLDEAEGGVELKTAQRKKASQKSNIEATSDEDSA